MIASVAGSVQAGIAYVPGDRSEALAGMTGDMPAAYAFAKPAHRSAHAAHRSYDIVTFQQHRRFCTQSDVQSGTILGVVDGLAREHARDPLGHLRLPREHEWELAAAAGERADSIEGVKDHRALG